MEDSNDNDTDKSDTGDMSAQSFEEETDLLTLLVDPFTTIRNADYS